MHKNSKGPKTFKPKPKKKENDLIDESLEDKNSNIEKDKPNKKNKNNDTISENVIVNSINPGVYDRDKDDLSSQFSKIDNFNQFNISIDDKEYNENKNEKKNNNENKNDSQMKKNKNDSFKNEDKKSELIDEEEDIEKFDLVEEDPDKEYPNDDDDNKEEEKKKDDKKNNFMSNADKTPKKTKKKKKNKKANPPKKEPIIIPVKNDSSSDKQSKKSDKKSNDISFISNKKEDDLISNSPNNSSGRDFPEIKKNKLIIKLNSFLYDIMNYDEACEKDKRGFFFTFLSLINNNSTLLFVISCDSNDLFTRVSVIILTLSFYIFINIVLMYNTSLLHLYTDRETYEKYEPQYIVINFVIPFLILYIPIMVLKKLTSIREFIYEQNYEFAIVVKAYEKGKLSPPQTQLRLHDIDTQISKCKNKMDYWEKKVFWGGFIFLLFNFYLTTCFCGIYQNSFDCVVANTIVSIVFTNVITFILFLLSTILRKYGLLNKSIMSFNISTIINPTFRLYGKEMETKNKDDDRNEEKRKYYTLNKKYNN